MGRQFTKVYKAPMNYDSYCFTNNPEMKTIVENKGWRYIYVDFPLSEDDAISSFQTKYIKFLQFLKKVEYSYFMKYEMIICTDHKLKLKDKHVKYLMDAVGTKKILIRGHHFDRENIWEEVGGAMRYERYARFMLETVNWIVEKIKEGYSGKPMVVWTSLILYKHQESDVINFTDKVYNDLQSIGTSECQIVWSILGQKYDAIIKIIKWDDLEIKWKDPAEKDTLVEIAKQTIKMLRRIIKRNIAKQC
jgi:hypothetical protein